MFVLLCYLELINEMFFLIVVLGGYLDYSYKKVYNFFSVIRE